MRAGLKLFALSVVIAAVGCTNDYGQFYVAEGVAGGNAGSGPQRDSGIDRSAAGAGGSVGRDGEPEDTAPGPDVAVEPVADASDARVEASADAPADRASDAPVDTASDAPRDTAADAESDTAADTASDAPGDALLDSTSDVAEVAADAGMDAAVRDGLADAVEAEAAPSCGLGTKACNGACVNVTDPATGCAAASCASCALAHASATCGAGGECAVLVCGAGFDDCDLAPANGCEAQLSSDIGNCGTCGRACAGVGVLSRQCAGGFCVSTCSLGRANCSFPASGSDDGCERVVDDVHCGSCGNDCTKQGGGLTCGAVAASQCGCSADKDCRVMSMGTCDMATGLCACGATTCKSGETCRNVPGPVPDVCSCNGGVACSGSQTCCQSPAGCRDLRSDPSNCGACGRSCPTGFFCSTGQCQCGTDFECNAGAPGTCVAGQCVCGGITCPKGQRCQPSGSCG